MINTVKKSEATGLSGVMIEAGTELTTIATSEQRKKALKSLEDKEMYEIDQDLVSELQNATPEEREMNPVCINPDGIIISGANRLYANSEWTIRVQNCDKEKALLERVKFEKNIKNSEARKEALRKTVTALFEYYQNNPKELGELAKFEKDKERQKQEEQRERSYSGLEVFPVKRKTQKGLIQEKIALDTGYTERYVRSFLPDRCKDIKKRHKTKTIMRKSISSSKKVFYPKHVYLIRYPDKSYDTQCPCCGKWFKIDSKNVAAKTSAGKRLVSRNAQKTIA